jgi:hypothetical protein
MLLDIAVEGTLEAFTRRSHENGLFNLLHGTLRGPVRRFRLPQRHDFYRSQCILRRYRMRHA